MIIKKDRRTTDRESQERVVRQKRVTKFDNEVEYKLIELCKILKDAKEVKIDYQDAFVKILKLYDKELKLYTKISNTSMEVVDAESTYQEIKKKLRKQIK